jgi:hypothetical protein
MPIERTFQVLNCTANGTRGKIPLGKVLYLTLQKFMQIFYVKVEAKSTYEIKYGSSLCE